MERNGKKPITKGASIGASAITPSPCYGLVIFNLVAWPLSDRLGNGGRDTLDTIDGNIKGGLLAIIQRTPIDRIGTYIDANRSVGAYLRLSHVGLFRLLDGGKVDGGLF